MGRDLTAALEERRRKKPRKSITLFDETIELPRSLSAEAGMRLVELEESGLDKLTQQQVIEFGRDLIGADTWERVLKLVDIDELDLVLEAIMAEMFGIDPDEADDGEDGDGQGGS